MVFYGNKFSWNCVMFTQEGKRCGRKAPLPMEEGEECWQHRQYVQSYFLN